MYYFIGRITSLTQNSNNNYQCSFNVETSIKIQDKLISIAFNEEENKFVNVPKELVVINQEVFNFLSVHSREKFKIKLESKYDNAKEEEQNKEKIAQAELIITGATLLNE